MLSRNINFIVLALLLAACGREKHEVVVPDCPPPPTCDCSAVQAELDALKAKQLVKPALEEDDRQNCTAEYAAQKDQAGLNRYNTAKTSRENEIKAVKDQVATTEDEAKQLPEPPVALGPAPVVTDELFPTLELVPHFDAGAKKCQVNWNMKPQDPIVHNDWRYAAADELANWKGNVQDLRNQPEGFSTDMAAAWFFVGGNDVLLSGNSEERRSGADSLISLLAKSGPAVQWAVGIALRLQPEEVAFSGRQLKRLYAATKLDMSKLDKDVLAAMEKVRKDHPEYNDYMVEVNMPSQYDFGPNTKEKDNYYTGVVLRYWRYKEAQESGSGKRAIVDLQKVIRAVAAGMKINL